MPQTLYVGPFTDYFHTALKQEAEAAGETAPERGTVRTRVEAWRSYISEGLVAGGHLQKPLDWDEGEQELYTHVLPDAALQALRLLLVHDSSGADAPTELPDAPEQHPRWLAAKANDFQQCGFDQILVPELWLPSDFEFTFECPYPDGHEAPAGSTVALRRHVLEAQRMRLPLDDAARERHREAVPESRLLVELAGFALVALGDAEERSRRNGLPILLHRVSA